MNQAAFVSRVRCADRDSAGWLGRSSSWRDSQRLACRLMHNGSGASWPQSSMSSDDCWGHERLTSWGSVYRAPATLSRHLSPEGATDCSHGGSGAATYVARRGTRGGGPAITRSPGGALESAQRTHSTPDPTSQPCEPPLPRQGRLHPPSRPTGCAPSVWRRTSLHPWLHSRAPLGQTISSLPLRAANVSDRSLNCGVNVTRSVGERRSQAELGNEARGEQGEKIESPLLKS